MGEWKAYELGNAPLEIIDGDRGKNYPSQNEFYSSGYCLFLTTKNVRINGFDFSDCQYISKEKDESLRKGKLQKNDVVLTTRGTVGNIGFFDSSVAFENMRINSGMVIVRPDNLQLDSVFNFYMFRKLQNDFYTFTSGSAQPQLPIRDLKKMEILLPPLEEQKAIAEVLSSLDDKIDLLHRQNKTLEEMAKTLFRQWFIEEAQDDWEEVTLADVLEIKYGKDHKLLSDGNIPVYGSGGIMRYADKFLYDKESILIPRKGTLTNIFYIDEPFWTVDTIFWSKINREKASVKFLFSFLKTMDLSILNVGSAVPSLTTKVLNEIKISLPSIDEQKKFTEYADNAWNKIKSNNIQMKTLENLRDTLLPKLMSGEVRVEG